MKYCFDEFKKNISGKKVAVVGVGISNAPLIKMIVNLNAQVTACDKRQSLGDIEDKLKSLGVTLCLGEDYLKGVIGCDVIFRTPSLRPDNDYLVKARKDGAYVTSEMEQFLKYCPCKVFGVTGSDGKTTTTTLISEMLKTTGRRVFLGGNIGNPLFNIIEEIKEDDFAVVELSSFQLMDSKYSPDVSVVTNVSPNHLDIHKDMNEYISAKKNVYLHQNENGVLILNRDNDITYSMKNEAKGKVNMFSIKDSSTFAHLCGEKLIVGGEEVCNIDEVKLPGMHNIENLLAAFSAAYGYVDISQMREIAKTFAGVEHRIEFVKEINGIKFYNDSIASSPTRTLAGIKSFKQKVILIAGGYDKKIPFDILASEGIDRIKTLIVMGNTKDKIKKAFKEEMKRSNKFVPIIEAQSLEDAVMKAYGSAVKGDIITMSPACASFDMFKNFEERGKEFKRIVNSIN